MLKKLGFSVLLLVMGCSNPVETVLDSKAPAIKQVMAGLDKHELQIIYTQIDSTTSGYAFTDYEFQVDPKKYFYPASTVKFPVALLAAEYVAKHPELTIDTPYSIEKDSVPHTIADDVKQIFCISDNEAYNRLYELLGRDYINTRLKELGLKETRIAHRLSTANATKSSRKKIQLYPSYEGPIFIPDTNADKSVTPLEIKGALKGKRHIKEGTLVSSPMDFTFKNAFALKDQHQLMKQLFFPENFKAKKEIHLRPSEEIQLKKMMRTLPRAAGYDPARYADSYAKFFLYGDTKEPIPPHIKIYNKAGSAYGTVTETAYIVDEKEKVSFLLSATILVNENAIFNDDIYEYDTLGIPFLAQLGREFHQYAIDTKNADL